MLECSAMNSSLLSVKMINLIFSFTHFAPSLRFLISLNRLYYASACFFTFSFHIFKSLLV